MTRLLIAAFLILAECLSCTTSDQEATSKATRPSDSTNSTDYVKAIWPAAVPGPYRVGYVVHHEYDHTRTFKSKFDYFDNQTQGTISRPIQISIWYPVDPNLTPQYMKLEHYFRTEVTETDFEEPQDEQYRYHLQHLKHVWPLEFRVPPEDRDSIMTRIDSLLQQRVFATRNAVPADGRFPLIIHMPGYNGSPSGSAYLFEYLASHGYVVAAVPNMGRYRRKIDNEAASLDNQARDMEFVVAHMKDLPFVDSRHTGTSGMSWGGMSNVLFGQRNYNVDAVLTLDGAITMPEELNLIEAVPGYSHKSFGAAYMQLLVCPAEATFRPKDLRFYDSLTFCDAYMIQCRGVNHDAFSCGYLRLRNLSEPDTARVAYLERFTRNTYQYALMFFDAYLKNDTSALALLQAATPLAAGSESADDMIVLQDYKKKKTRPLSRSEFVDIIKSQGAHASLEIYREYCKQRPQNNLVVSSSIGPLFMDAFECGDFDEALAICELWQEGLPRARGPLFSKARIYTVTGRTDDAIQCYERILELDGSEESSTRARERLQALRQAGNPEPPVTIRWLGQSSFMITTSGGTTILTDPIDFKGYKMPPNTTANIVTVSHEHPDHNCVNAVSGSPLVFRGTDSDLSTINVIDTVIGDVRMYNVSSYHDPGHHGLNAVFVFEFDGIRVAHLGDIGTVLTDEQIDRIGDVDVLMVPVGGQFTITGAKADTIVAQLNVKRVVIPMHYKTEAFDSFPYSADPFLNGKNHVQWSDGDTFTLHVSNPPEFRTYVVLDY